MFVAHLPSEQRTPLQASMSQLNYLDMKATPQLLAGLCGFLSLYSFRIVECNDLLAIGVHI